MKSPALSRRVARWLALFVAMAAAWPSLAKIQFDVFPGHDGVARSGGWYPVWVEVFNDGPSFDGVVEVGSGQMGGLAQRMAVELPTNTRKRIAFTCFTGSQGFLAVDARLYDKGGKLKAETLGQRLAQASWESFLMGAAPQSFGGMPAFPDVGGRQVDHQPRVTRLAVGQGLETFPDNPIALESLNAIYLNSSRAIELKEPQADALLAWLHGGGHLIVAVDQPGDVSATAWLRDVLPVAVNGSSTVSVGAEVEGWVRRPGKAAGTEELSFALYPPSAGRASDKAKGDSPYDGVKPDPSMARAQAPAVGFTVRSGTVLMASDGKPLVVSAPKGRGLVTALAFNPEREPFKSWKEKPWFWAKLAGVPPGLLAKGDVNIWGGRGIDAVFGAMIETRQVRKLPVGVLLLLLLVYLLVIGPLDRWWLKKINRPMLTWATFPAYVVLFSVLIYYIGFRLRAGNSEWTELHVVDVYPRTGSALLRGRSFGSVYSPANNLYPVSVKAEAAAFRGEFQGMLGSVGSGNRAKVRVDATGYDAELEVPVWTSMLTVGEWVDSGPAPIEARLEGPTLALANRREAPLTNIVIIHDRKVRLVPSMDGGATLRIDLGSAPAPGEGMSVDDLTRDWSALFHGVANRRNEVFGGGNGEEHIDNWPGASVAASLIRRMATHDGEGARSFVWPPGLDLSPLVDRGDVVVMAFAPNDSVIPPVNRFDAIWKKRSTLYRLVLNPARAPRP